MNTPNRPLSALLLAGLACAASPLAAQPAPQPEPARAALRIEEFDPSALRERLSRRAADLDAEMQRIRQALGALDAGAPPHDVVETLRPAKTPMPRAEGREVRKVAPTHELRERMPSPAFHPMSPEEHASLMEFVRANMPGLADRIEQLQAERPEAAERLLFELRHKIGDFRRVAHERPQDLQMRLDAFRTDMEIRQTAMDFVDARSAGDQARLAEATAALEKLVAERVEISLREREQELAMLDERVQRLREELTQSRANPDEIVARRLDDLLTRLENAPAPPEDGPRERRRGHSQ